ARCVHASTPLRGRARRERGGNAPLSCPVQAIPYERGTFMALSLRSHEGRARWTGMPTFRPNRPSRTEEPRPMNTPLRRASVFCLALILALMGWATWIQGAKASDYMGDPHNPRVTIGKYAAPLGNILVDGEPVTGSAATSSTLKYKRTYKDGPLYAPVTGFTSQIFGSNQLESLYGDLLDGSDGRLQTAADAVLHRRLKCGDT